MTTASDDTRQSTDLTMPPPGRAPVAVPAAGYVGTLIALLVLGLGVIALRDSAVAAGWLDGQPFLVAAIGWIDGLGFDWWMIPVGVLSIVVGAWWILVALRPRRHTAVAVKAASGVWIGPADLARLASHAAETVPGVTGARSSATLRRITVTADATPSDDDPGLDAAVTAAVRNAVDVVASPPTLRVRTRTEKPT